MAWPTSTFPTALDEITDIVDNVSEAKADDINGAYDAIEKLEAKVGIDGSAVATSLDYRVATIEGSGEVSTTGNDNPVELDLGTVTAGDRIFVESAARVLSATAQYPMELKIEKSSGSATIAFLGTEAALESHFEVNTGTEGRGHLSGVCKVTGGGTLVLKSTQTSVGSESTVSHQISAFFLKKA